VRIPVADGAAIAALYREGEVLGVSQEGEVQAVTVRLEPWQVDRLRGAGHVVEPVRDRAAVRRASG